MSKNSTPAYAARVALIRAALPLEQPASLAARLMPMPVLNSSATLAAVAGSIVGRPS